MMEQQMGGPGLPPNFNLTDAREMLCECGNDTFMPGVRFRKVSRLITGGAKDSVLPIEMYLCTQCGKPLQELLPDELKDKKIIE
jgi:hypothetical protein